MCVARSVYTTCECVCWPTEGRGMGILATTMATVTSWLVLLLALSEIKFPSLSFLCTRGYYLICAAGRKWATATALTWTAHEGSRNARVPDCQSSAFTAQRFCISAFH